MSKKFEKQTFVLKCLEALKGEHDSQNGEGLTAIEISEWIIEKYPNECYEKARVSQNAKQESFFNDVDKKTLNKENFKWVIFNEIIAHYAPRHYQKKSPPPWFQKGIRFHDTKPLLYYLAKDKGNYEKEWIDLRTSVDTDDTSTASATSVYIKDGGIDENDGLGYDGDEKALYKKLGEFLYNEYGILSRRIKHEQSKKGKGGDDRWLFPDVVGLERLGEESHGKIKELSDNKFKLWSFEVKINLNRSQARNAYFQAVSNSFWANFGYLVAIGLKPDAKEELKILANRYGIGVIQLNHENPVESSIIIPAKENDNVDWDIANRITEINDDFKKYIKSIAFYKINYAQEESGIKEKDWDLTPWKDDD